jgi:hypothetical protein
VHGELAEHPRRESRARCGRVERRQHGQAHGRAALPAAHRCQRQPGFHH